MKIRRKSLWRSKNCGLSSRARKFENMRSAKQRKRIDRASDTMADSILPCTAALFTVSIRCRDGHSVSIRIHEHPCGGLTISPTRAGRKVAAVIQYYRPAIRLP